MAWPEEVHRRCLLHGQACISGGRRGEGGGAGGGGVGPADSECLLCASSGMLHEATVGPLSNKQAHSRNISKMKQHAFEGFNYQVLTLHVDTTTASIATLLPAVAKICPPAFCL